MTRRVITCEAEDAVQSALNTMARHQVRRLPVVDEGQRLVGIISQADLATRLNDSEMVAEVVEEISRPSTASSWVDG